MFRYVLRRILLTFPTLIGITVICFVIMNMAPGGPIEQKLSQLKFANQSVGSATDATITPEQIESLKKQFGFDQPIHIRYFIWLKNIVTLNLGTRFTDGEPVLDLLLTKLPVSLQFGVTSIILVYLISIPLGIAKAVRNGTNFDLATSVVLMVMYSIPPLILGILLQTYLAGGQLLNIFPLNDLYSDNYSSLSFSEKIWDRVMHFILPLTCYVVNMFTVMSILMKNSLLEEIKLDYVRTARAKGLPEKKVVYKHALRNAIIPIITGLGSYLTLFFGGSIIVEQVFNLDGMGLLSYKSILSREYNVVMALIFFQSLISMFGRLLSDILYVIVDPRIDFD